MAEQHYLQNREDFTINACVIDDAVLAMGHIPQLYADSIAKIKAISERLLDTNNWRGKARDEFKDTYRIIERYLGDDEKQIASMKEILEGFQEIYNTIDTEASSALYSEGK